MFDHAYTACNLTSGRFQTSLMYYDEQLKQREIFHQKLLYGLDAALEEEQFQVYYQPKYNIQCDPPCLVSAEALVRCKHPELGMVSPGEFIPLFESKGVISQVDSYVWQKAAGIVRMWREKYGIALPVSVNLSRTDMFDASLSGRLNLLIWNNGLNYSDIKLEVTESAYTDDSEHVLNVISGLQAARAIRALSRSDAGSIPVIAMTANVFDEDVERSLQAGMNAHLSKPVEPDRLYAELIRMTAEPDRNESKADQKSV